MDAQAHRFPVSAVPAASQPIVTSSGAHRDRSNQKAVAVRRPPVEIPEWREVLGAARSPAALNVLLALRSDESRSACWMAYAQTVAFPMPTHIRLALAEAPEVAYTVARRDRLPAYSAAELVGWAVTALDTSTDATTAGLPRWILLRVAARFDDLSLDAVLPTLVDMALRPGNSELVRCQRLTARKVLHSSRNVPEAALVHLVRSTPDVKDMAFWLTAKSATAPVWHAALERKLCVVCGDRRSVIHALANHPGARRDPEVRTALGEAAASADLVAVRGLIPDARGEELRGLVAILAGWGDATMMAEVLSSLSDEAARDLSVRDFVTPFMSAPPAVRESLLTQLHRMSSEPSTQRPPAPLQIFGFRELPVLQPT